MALQECRYKTLAELKAAYDAGGLSGALEIDNDRSQVYDYVPGTPGDLSTMGWVKVYEGGSPESLLKEALTLLGIPWENA